MGPDARSTKTALTLLMLFSAVVSGAAVARAQQATAGLVAAFADRERQAVPTLGAPLPEFERPRRLLRTTPAGPDFYWAQRFTEGMITYTPRTGLQVVTGPLFRAWTRVGTEAGLGLPTSGETANSSGNR